MAKDQVNELFRFRPWPPGDPWVLVEAVLQEVQDEKQQRQVIALALESVAATLKANLAFVDGVRQIIGRSQ